MAAYRREFQPSAQLEEPYVIAGVNVIAADTAGEANQQLHAAKRNRVRVLIDQGRTFTDEEADMVLQSPAGRRVEHMLAYSAAGTPSEVRTYVEAFARHAGADELIVAHQSPTTEGTLRSVELLADAMQSPQSKESVHAR